jgi:hypothetical protein
MIVTTGGRDFNFSIDGIGLENQTSIYIDIYEQYKTNIDMNIFNERANEL